MTVLCIVYYRSDKYCILCIQCVNTVSCVCDVPQVSRMFHKACFGALLEGKACGCSRLFSNDLEA